MATIDGNDVSSYQPDWTPKKGQEFVGIKSTEGTSYANPSRDEQETEARKAGLVILWYHWLHHGNIDAQVAYFASNTSIKDGDVLVCDWEQAGCTTADKDQYIRKLKARFPKNRVLLYCNVNWWRTVDTSSYYGDGLWIASYGSLSNRPAIETPWLFWQHSQTPIDQNIAAFKSKADLVAWAKGGATPVVIDTRAKVSFRGGWTCGCVATSLPLVEQDMIKAGVIKNSIDIWQLGYRSDVSASAGTHSKGGCTDVDQYSDEALRIWRKWGWTTQHRTRAQGFDMDHGHGFPYGCTHLAPSAQSQATSWKNQRDGLLQNKTVTGPGWQVLDWKDAIKKYAGSSGAAENVAAVSAEKDKEEDDMRERIIEHRTEDQKVKQVGAYQPLWVANSSSCTYAYGPGFTDVTLYLVLDNYGPEDTLYVRPVAYDYKGKKSVRRGAGELVEWPKSSTSAGWQWGPHVNFKALTGAPAKGYTSRRLRFEWTCTNPDVVIKDVVISGTKEQLK